MEMLHKLNISLNKYEYAIEIHLVIKAAEFALLMDSSIDYDKS